MAKIYGIGSINNSLGVNKLVAVKNSQHYVWNSGTGAWDSQSLFVPFGDKVEFAVSLDKLFAVNRLSATRTYDGNTWVTSGGLVDKAPRGAYVMPFNVRNYIADIILHGAGNSFRSRIWYSDLPTTDQQHLTWGFEQGSSLTMTAASAIVTDTAAKFLTRSIKVGDPFTIVGINGGEYTVSSVDSETQLTLTSTLTNSGTAPYWVGGNYLEYQTNNSDYIRGMGQNSQKLLAFKKNSLGRSDGISSMQDVKSAPGTTSHRSIVNIGEYTFYFHPTGIWRYNGVGSTVISGPIWDYIAGISSSNYPDIVGWNESERYLKMAVGDITNNATGLSVTNCVLVLDTIDNQWSIETKAILPTAITTFEESNAINTYVGASDGNVYQMDTGVSWNGVNMPSDITTGAIFPMSPEILVEFTRALAFAAPSLGLTGRYKLLYELDKRIQKRFREFNTNTKDGGSFGGKDMVEWRFDNDHRIASGVEIFIEESSQSESYLFERLSIFYKNPTLF